MENKRLEDKMDKMSDEISSIKQILAVNTAQLEIHIEGVRLAREQNTILRQDTDSRFNQISADLKPLKSHVSFVRGALWAVGITGTIFMALNQLGFFQKLMS